MDAPAIMTIEEVAAYLRVSEKTVYSWAKQGKIPSGKLGTSWRFLRSDVENWVHSQLSKPEPEPTDDPQRVHGVLAPDRILVMNKTYKADALSALVDVLASAEEVSDRDALLEGIWWRESLLSTGLGLGVAVPHVRLAAVDNVVMAVGINGQGIVDYETLDSTPVRIIFMVAAGTSQHADYLNLMATLSFMIKDEAFRSAVLAAPEPAEIYRIMTTWPVCTP